MKMNDTENQISKTKKSWLLGVSLLGFILAHFSGPLIFLKMRPTNAMAILEGVLRGLGNILVAVTISIFITVLLRTEKHFKLSKKQIATATSLILVALTLALLSFKSSSAFSNFDKYLQGVDTETRERIINKLNSSDSIEKKSKLSRLYAQVIYEEDGKIIEYLTPDGKTATYVPSTESIKNRDMLMFFRTYRKMSPPLDIFIGVIWLLSILVAIGIAVYRRQSETATPNQDARP